MEYDLLDLIYEAAIEPHRWSAVGERFADVVEGGVAALTFRNDATGEGAGIASRMCASALEPVWGYFANRNPLMKITDLPARPRVLTDEEKLAKSELIRTEYYNEFLLRNEMHSLLMARLAVWSHNTIVLNVGRRAGLEPFGQREVEIANRFHPHLVRAFRLSQRLTGMRTLDRGIRQTVDGANSAVVLVDAAARIQYANAAAEALLQGKSGLSVERGMLRAATEAATRRLRECVARAAARDDRRSGGTMPIERDGLRPLSVIVSPLADRDDSLFGAHATVLVSISDPERKSADNGGSLRDLFGLTPAESRLCMRLMEGADLRSAAKQAQVSVNTARTHLAHIFQKTGTSKQGELIRLLMLTASAGTG